MDSAVNPQVDYNYCLLRMKDRTHCHFKLLFLHGQMTLAETQYSPEWRTADPSCTSKLQGCQGFFFFPETSFCVPLSLFHRKHSLILTTLICRSSSWSLPSLPRYGMERVHSQMCLDDISLHLVRGPLSWKYGSFS